MNNVPGNHPNQGFHAAPSAVCDGPQRKKVIILAMGNSRNDFDAMQLLENRPEILQDAELWGINYMGAIKRLHRIVHVDPVHRYLGHAPVKDMCDYALKDNIPIYTSWPHPFYPNHVVYPADKVFQAFGHTYFNNSVAWAIGLAGAEGFTDVGLFGADFSYPNAHLSESGRACCEFLLGQMTQRGVRICIASSSTLLDLYCQQQPYGFFSDPAIPPSQPGGKLMTAPEIMAHVEKMRNASRFSPPQISAFQMAVSTPRMIDPIPAMAPEHTLSKGLSVPMPRADGSMTPEQADMASRLAVAVPPPTQGGDSNEARNL